MTATTKNGASMGRHFADMYHIWAELADRHGDLLFLRYADRFITFGEHATIVGDFLSECPYTTPIGGGQEIGPIYVLVGYLHAEAVIAELMAHGHGVCIREPERIPLTIDEEYKPARLVRLTEDRQPPPCCTCPADYAPIGYGVNRAHNAWCDSLLGTPQHAAFDPTPPAPAEGQEVDAR